MAHLIQPIDIAGALYCPNYHDNRVTEGVATNIIFPTFPPDVVPDVSTKASPWIVPIGDNDYSEITFGVTCCSSIILHVSLASGETDYSCGVDIHITDGINPVSINYYEPGNPADSGDIIISIPANDCGSLVSVLVYDAMGPKPADLVVTLEIISVT